MAYQYCWKQFQQEYVSPFRRAVDSWGGMMQALWQDVRFGVRMLMKNRLVSLVCIIALALGIGANAAIFSMAEAFLLHPVPFENADSYLMLADRHTDSRGAGFGTVDDVPIAPA